MLGVKPSAGFVDEQRFRIRVALVRLGAGLGPRPRTHRLPAPILLHCPPVSDSIPLAYFITFRTYGTWLHGDDRGAVDRFHNCYGTPLIAPDNGWLARNERVLSQHPVTLTDSQRDSIDYAIRQTCEQRKWLLRALNVRTNHVHVVLSSESNRPDRILNALKANATRQLRQSGSWLRADNPWSEGGSKRYVWTEMGLERVIDYVVNGQDGPLPKLN